MRVTVLIENTSENELICEHGLSLLIEYNGRTILLDAGSTEAFYENARVLGLSLEKVDVCVLSHGHYDHSGGFGILLQNNKKIKIYAQKSVMNPYYSGNNNVHEIGIPENVRAYKDRFELVDGALEIIEGVCLVPHSSKDLDKIGARSRLYKKEQDKMIPDDFAHEQSLVFDTGKGLIVFNSCSHGGVENILREAKEACGGKRIYAYIGGLHMKGKANGEEICTFTEDEVDALCNVIRDEQIKYVYTGHCTGLVGLNKMKERLGDIVQALTTGLQFEFDNRL